MNLPNKITLFRVCLIPVFLYFYLAEPVGGWYGSLISLAIFGLAAATDALDGYIARRRKLITNFGKLMDPLADKLLVSAALIAMTAAGDLPAWVAVLLISREFFISGLRQIALEHGLVLAASFWAKVKTAVQMIMIIYLLMPLPEHSLADAGAWVLIAAGVFFSIISAVEYAYKNRQVFR